MIYFCADDYGISETASAHIEECVEKGILNKVSVFPNFDKVNLNRLLKNDVTVALHLNLVEGRCMSDAELIADEKGNFKYEFGGLLKLSFFNKKEFEKQIYKEIKAQVLYWKSILPENVPFCIDSHQHTHMIPSVFKVMLKVLKDEKIHAEYIRTPAEPLMPFIKKPSLYFTYSTVNVIKQLLLNFLWFINKKHKIKKTPFFGILFSGKMDEKRVNRILPEFMRYENAEILFHPGYQYEKSKTKFSKFYLSENRKTEYNCVMKLSERGVYKCPILTRKK